MSASVSILGSALLALLLAGYVAQKYLPAPTPRIAGIDLGTTYSSIGVYHPGSGRTEIIADENGKKSIPSIVAFLSNGTVLVGHAALEQSEHNPAGTLYDAKRFIGRTFSPEDPQFLSDVKRYPFKIELDSEGRAFFIVPLEFDSKTGKTNFRRVSPVEVGALILRHLKKMAEKVLDVSIAKAVISVPAEFNDVQRNATRDAANQAGMEILRVISEPTAAALAYGLDKKAGVEHILVVDLGGGTLDVSLLWLQSGMFITRAMAGNNRLGGQDFNEKVVKRLMEVIEASGTPLTDPEGIQNLRLAVEHAKLRMACDGCERKTVIDLNLHSWGHFHYELSREEFERLNQNLFSRVLDPVKACLNDAEIDKSDIDEIVLVGGSTRISKVRKIVGEYFGKASNFGVDPELAVVTGVAVQAGVLGGAWPLSVSATELASDMRKIHVYTSEEKN